MSLKFVMGPSGAGKTHYLYQHIINESIKNPDINYIVLVPEQFTLSTQKELVRRHPRRGIMNIDVLSFARLAYRVFEETGKGNLPVLDDEGKNLVLRKIAADRERDLVVLKGNMKKTGYISEVKSVISELVQYDVGEEELDEVMERAGEGSRLYYKLQDIRTLYSGFSDYLEGSYTTKEELLDTLSRIVPESAMLANSVIALDGFTGFTPVQNRLLGELMKKCRQVIVTATIGRRENPYSYKHPYQLFALTKKMVTSLIGIARERDITVDDPVELFQYPSYRFAENGELAHLEDQLFRVRPQPYEGIGGISHIRLSAQANPAAEAAAAAAAIRRLVRTEGYRYREIGVIVADMDTYGDFLTQSFSQYEIPAFVDQKKSILQNPVVEYIRSFLNMFKEQFSYESVFRFLKTGLPEFTRTETEVLENYCLANGIRGFKRWSTPFRNADEQTEALRERFAALLTPYAGVFSRRRKTVTEITTALYDFMVQEKIEARLQEKEAYFTGCGELALAKEYSQLYRIFIDLMDKFVALLGDEPVGMPEYIQLLDAGLSEARVGVIPPGVDQVVVGDLTRTRLGDIKALFLLGANDSFIPGNLTGHGLLSERDKTVFADSDLPLSPGGKEKAYTQKLYLYQNLTKPSDRLYISFSRSNSQGEAQRESYLVTDLQKLFPDLPDTVPEEPLWRCELTKESGFIHIIKALWQKDTPLPPEIGEMIRWYRQDEQCRSRVDHLLDARFYKREISDLTRQIAEELYGTDFRESISRIENFENCAYAHFLNYGLRLQEREEYAFEAFDMGNICHGALEKYSNKVAEAGLDWEEVAPEQKDELLDQALSEEVSEHRNDILSSTAQNAFLVDKMKKILNTSIWALTRQLSAGDFKPEWFEERFDKGIIDRIDICQDEDRVYVKVIDYKTGSKRFDISQVYYGLQLQLMFYMKAALQKLAAYPENKAKQIVPAGAFYYHIFSPMIDKAAAADIEEKLLKEMVPSGILNKEASILAHFVRDKEQAPYTLPIAFKKDGDLTKNAENQVVNTDDFDTIIEYSDRLVKEDKEKIKAGEIAPDPVLYGDYTPCAFCTFAGVCGYDAQTEGYRDTHKMDMVTTLALMKGDNDDGSQMDEESAESH